MGDRVSISFSNLHEGWTERTVSPALFHHWGGMDFVNQAYAYVRELKKEINGSFQPLDRLEPGTVLVDFLRYYTAEVVAYQKGSNSGKRKAHQKPYYKNPNRIYSSLYLGRDENEGDNSDNGHHEIRLDEVK